MFHERFNKHSVASGINLVYTWRYKGRRPTWTSVSLLLLELTLVEWKYLVNRCTGRELKPDTGNVSTLLVHFGRS